jgi:4-diphosphocytidyl-2-C-methyl-D-erythritol kinase
MQLHYSRSAHAKVNIGLYIKGRRPDGYHNIESLFYPVELADNVMLTVLSPDASTELNCTGLPISGPLDYNLCYRAWKLLYEQFPAKVLPVNIHLYKVIPMGAGLGGGSSDAAAVLMLCNDCFSLGLNFQQLAQLGVQLGADVPFFIYGQPMFVSGIGEILEPFALQHYFRVELITPEVHSDTAQAYRSLDYNLITTGRSLKADLQLPLSNWKDVIVNDFEPVLFRQYPILATYKAELYERGAFYAAMTGSGSALFGLFYN